MTPATHYLPPLAGLAAYPSWVDTLRLLARSMLSMGRPAACLFTDYVEEAVHRGQEMCAALLPLGRRDGQHAGAGTGPALAATVAEGAAAAAAAGTAAPGGNSGAEQQQQAVAQWELLLSGIQVNPFRKPLLLRPTDNALPGCSNAFALWLTVGGSSTSRD